MLVTWRVEFQSNLRHRFGDVGFRGHSVILAAFQKIEIGSPGTSVSNAELDLEVCLRGVTDYL